VTFFLTFIKILCEILSLVVFLRAILSWVSPGQNNMMTVLLYQITEPLLSPLRRILPRTGMMDFSPLVAMVLLQLIAYLLP